MPFGIRQTKIEFRIMANLWFLFVQQLVVGGACERDLQSSVWTELTRMLMRTFLVISEEKVVQHVVEQRKSSAKSARLFCKGAVSGRNAGASRAVVRNQQTGNRA